MSFLPIGRIPLLLGLLTAFVASSAKIGAQEATLPEVLAAHAEHCGDSLRLQTITSVVEHSLAETSAAAPQIRILRAKVPDKIRIETLTETGRLIQGFDGTTAWTLLEPRHGTARSVPLAPDAARVLRLSALLALRNLVLDAEALGLSAALRDNDPDADAQHLVVVSSSFLELMRLRVERKTGRPLARIEHAAGRRVVTHFEAFRLVEGVAWPAATTTTTEDGGSVTWRLVHVRLDEEQPDSLFAPPPGMIIAPLGSST